MFKELPPNSRHLPTHRRKSPLLVGAMYILIFLCITLVALTMTELGRSRSFYFILGTVALLTAVVSFVEARLYRSRPPGSEMSVEFENIDLASILLSGFVSVVAFSEALGMPILRAGW